MDQFIKILKAILFGIIEGITEWLPISSTGHMILLEDLLHVKDMFIKEGSPTYGDAFWNMFLVVIQLGAILAVIIFFWKKLWPFTKKKTKEERKDIYNIWLKTLIACLPAAIIGLLFDDLLDKYLYNSWTVSITLIVYGIFFILMEIWNKKRNLKIESVKDISYRYALIIGAMQLLALIPGTSRSGVTILGAMLLGINRKAGAEFSFYLSIPIMFGASLLKGVKFFIDFGMPGLNETIFLLVGCLTAFIISLLVIKWLMNFIKKHNFMPFGIYRIVLGVILIIYFVSISL